MVTAVSVGGATYSSALSPAGTVAYAAVFNGNQVIPIDTSTNTAGTPIGVGLGPVNVTFFPDGSTAYVSNSPSAVRIMNTSTFAISDVVTVGNGAYNLTISLDANLLYVSNWGANTVSAVDLNTNIVTATIVGLVAPLGIAITPDGSKVLVGDWSSNNLNIIDTTTNTISNTLNMGAEMAGLGMSSNGSVLYVVFKGVDAGISVFDIVTETVSTTIATTGTNGWAIWGDFLGNVAAQPPGEYNVGGNVSGLAVGKQVVLQNNGSDDLTASINGVFTFNTGITNGGSYNVTVSTQPTGQTCTVTDGSGTIATADVTNVAVTCVDDVAPTYSVGGTVSGLTGTGLALQNNGGDTLAVAAAATAFTFATELLDLATYAVTVSAQPTGQTCSVTNGSGTIAAADVADVDVACVDDVVPPIQAIPVPTLSQWALVMLSLLLGLMVFSNRKHLF
jgi:YVTN family beta-propeller protein